MSKLRQNFLSFFFLIHLSFSEISLHVFYRFPKILRKFSVFQISQKLWWIFPLLKQILIQKLSKMNAIQLSVALFNAFGISVNVSTKFGRGLLNII